MELEAERVEHQRHLGVVDEHVQEKTHLANELLARLAEAVQSHSLEVSDLPRKKAEATATAETAKQWFALAHQVAAEELLLKLDDHRAKNNELRAKNCEEVEAMRSYERTNEAQGKELSRQLTALKASHSQDMHISYSCGCHLRTSRRNVGYRSACYPC
ncbi:hypothetical protein V5799_014050 [Amblyomma americanum]|uniref:Uncharacterized protein n=1 Tax=Amblyomma americanum TaxID=6943 RepID=A0AAQ4E448_AMBAM